MVQGQKEENTKEKNNEKRWNKDATHIYIYKYLYVDVDVSVCNTKREREVKLEGQLTANRRRRHDFPTAESPINKSLNR